MRDVLHHRGPDDAGLRIEGGVALGHRRLSILDLSERGHQPMDSGSGRYCIVYNGEIYNYRDLRAELDREFRSDSDTEVLVEGLEAWGLDKLLARLDGIFAFAAWDRKERRLLCAVDPLGVKPFFYAETPEQFAFASEMKSLWAAGVPKDVDADTLEELLVFRTVCGEATPFRGIRRLQAGHKLELRDNRATVRPYWRATDHVGTDAAFVEVWRSRFSQAVADQRVSDVPLGTLLSGGLDSSTITAELARAEAGQISTFTVSMPPDEGVDEWPYAEMVSKKWNTRGHQLRIPAGDVLNRLRAAQSFHDEPLAHGNDMHIHEIARLAKEHVTVLLSGEGADETLGGYTRYEPVRYPRSVAVATSALGAPLRFMLSMFGSQKVFRLRRLLSHGSLANAMLYNAADLVPSDLARIGLNVQGRFDARRTLLDDARSATGDPIRQLLLYDIQTFLRSILNRNDRMTMGASIECRVPFLAVGVVEAALKLPMDALFHGRYGKWILREHARDLLPDAVLQRPKWGLGIPWARYFRNDPSCREFVRALPETDLARLMDAPGLDGAVRDFLAGDDRLLPVVYQVFAMAVWWEQVVAQDAAAAGRSFQRTKSTPPMTE